MIMSPAKGMRPRQEADTALQDTVFQLKRSCRQKSADLLESHPVHQASRDIQLLRLARHQHITKQERYNVAELRYRTSAQLPVEVPEVLQWE